MLGSAGARLRRHRSAGRRPERCASRPQGRLVSGCRNPADRPRIRCHSAEFLHPLTACQCARTSSAPLPRCARTSHQRSSAQSSKRARHGSNSAVARTLTPQLRQRQTARDRGTCDTEILSTTLRGELARLRHVRGWSYDQLASRSGVGRATLVSMESGKPRRNPDKPASRGSLESWYRARAFDVDLGDLLRHLYGGA
ncbi:helix-turn-helix transcriptional regulator [Herbiconiux sp.]|uniref:helix-turn-helix transcriptional regulator n=1 Tax=Herbiconiux sp. TaxID=1871186 RepID=UPI00344CCBC3